MSGEEKHQVVDWGETCFEGTSSVLWNPWHLFKFWRYPELPNFNPHLQISSSWTQSSDESSPSPTESTFYLEIILNLTEIKIMWRIAPFFHQVLRSSFCTICFYHCIHSHAPSFSLPLCCHMCVCVLTYLYICKCYLLWVIWGWVINIMATDFCTI